MSSSASVEDMQRAQEAILQSGGFLVKNGFIDESPAGPAQEGSRSRRHSCPPPSSPTAADWSPRHPGASSAPTPARMSSHTSSSSCAGFGIDDDNDSTHDGSSQGSSPRGRGRCLSSTDSAQGDEGVGHSSTTDPTWSAAEELRTAILTKCAFLRFAGDTYKTFPSPSSMSGCTGSFMFYVWGLPWARRARWVVPLRMSVAKVLECSGYRTQMCAGVLYVSDEAESFKIRISFAPSLAAAPASR